MPWKKVPVYGPFHESPIAYEWVYESIEFEEVDPVDILEKKEKYEKAYWGLKNELKECKLNLKAPRYFYLAYSYEQIVEAIKSKCWRSEQDKLDLDLEKITKCLKQTREIGINIKKYGLPSLTKKYSIYNELYIVEYYDLSENKLKQIEYYILPTVWDNYVNKFQMAFDKWKEAFQNEEDIRYSKFLQIMKTYGFKNLFGTCEDTIPRKIMMHINYFGFDFKDMRGNNYEALTGIVLPIAEQRYSISYFCKIHKQPLKLVIMIKPDKLKSFKVNVSFNKKSFLKKNSPYKKNLINIFTAIDESKILKLSELSKNIPWLAEVDKKEDFKDFLKEAIKQSLIHERSKLGLTTNI